MAVPTDINVVQRKQKQAKIEEYMYTGTMNVEHEMYYNTSINWSHQGSTRKKSSVMR
jgi:hypothetical protein